MCVSVHLCVCAGEHYSQETKQSNKGSDLGESLPESLDPDEVYNRPLLCLSALCLFIYPLKADWSRLHDQAEWILSSVPLPRQSVYGAGWRGLLRCCRAEAAPIKPS